VRARRLTLGALDTNCWLVDDGAGGPALVIDPADEAQVILETLGEQPVAGVILTHGHFDHLGAVGAIIEATGAPLLVHGADAASITSPVGNGGALFGFEMSAPAADELLVEGAEVSAGHVRLRVVHTPGHTPGSICLVGEGHVFSGDTVFAGSIGRTDFPGGDAAAIRRSVGRLAELPDEVRVHPGHGPDTTIGRERRVNPYFPRA